MPSVFIQRESAYREGIRLLSLLMATPISSQSSVLLERGLSYTKGFPGPTTCLLHQTGQGRRLPGSSQGCVSLEANVASGEGSSCSYKRLEEFDV